MSRIHDALRRLEVLAPGQQPEPSPAPEPGMSRSRRVLSPPIETTFNGAARELPADLLSEVEEIPFNPDPEAHLLTRDDPEAVPSEEFRTLRTRLNHLQGLGDLRTIVVTSPSPAEGKSFTAANLALAQSHMADNLTLLADFDFRRPTLHRLFQVERAPGVTDYLLGKVPLGRVIRKIRGTNLYLMPTGSGVRNPLELLNLREVRTLLSELKQTFNWVIMDSPPLLFSADANLLTTMADGTVLVVRVGATTIDTVKRAVQSLCENNVLGIVVNGARAGELYSRYSYYYSRPEESEAEEQPEETGVLEDVGAGR